MDTRTDGQGRLLRTPSGKPGVQNDRQIIMQDSLLDNACHVEISSVYMFAKIIDYFEAGDHSVKFINIRTLQ